MNKIIISLLLFCCIFTTPIKVFASDGGDEKYRPVCPPCGNITIDKDGENITITIENKKKTATITIVKIDKDTKLPIEGVKFVLKDSAGNVVAEGVTDSNGKIVFENLPLGDYTYEEISAPKPY